MKAGKVKIIAPVGFLEAAVAENVLAGNVMSRRAIYQYGALLPTDAQGPGRARPRDGRSRPAPITLIPPTDEITETGQKMTIDGLDFEFLLAPDTEAPSEMHWFIEELGALTAAENCCHTLHNTYTLRGAQIRDPQAWSRYLNETIERWGEQSEVMYGMHHWPVWGTDRVIEMLSKAPRRLPLHQRPDAAARQPRLHAESRSPRWSSCRTSSNRHWALRGYYGTVNHNVKATYVKYLGWFDGNPANLHTLPPAEAAASYVEFMGGADAVLAKARDGLRRAASTAGSPRSSTTSSSPTPRTRRRGSCRPTRSSSSATSRRPAPGATST